ncbi:MAG: response regulator [Oscillatoriaceae cyanobacterium Prado104]|jgi:class 3 adenylate cyclase/FixJ family two-component response regulator|nr:response regulator [Oscillatoriaceae cyanobacterium Prado104]
MTKIFKRPVIICVDDEVTILTSLKSELRKDFGEQYRVEIAEGGEDALELLEELIEDGDEIPLIISDYIMPDMKGDELLRRVHELSPKTLKVMLTGQATIEGVANAVKYAKLYRYISKPWQNEDLKLTVTEAIHSYVQDKELAEKNAKLLQMNSELEALTCKQSQLIAELQEKESHLQALNESFLRFVPRQFLQLLEKSTILDIHLGQQIQQEISVLFSDIRDFTSLSEQMTPDDNFKFINAYLSRMEPEITENNGFIDKYMGDAIMALFNGEPDRAVTAGIAMLQMLAEYNIDRRKRERTPIKIGIGINTGILILGTVGGQSRIDGTVIGDAVNLASRLEGLTKEYRVPLLISDRTFRELKNPENYRIRWIDRVRVKGKSEQVAVYEVFDADPPELCEKKLAAQSNFESAIVAYHASDREEAVRLFQQCLQANPEDTVAKIYLQRCQ